MSFKDTFLIAFWVYVLLMITFGIGTVFIKLFKKKYDHYLRK